MTEAERKLLIWCGIMLVRGAPLTLSEADEIDHLIADVRAPLPKIEWDTPNSGRVVETEKPRIVNRYILQLQEQPDGSYLSDRVTELGEYVFALYNKEGKFQMLLDDFRLMAPGDTITLSEPPLRP